MFQYVDMRTFFQVSRADLYSRSQMNPGQRSQSGFSFGEPDGDKLDIITKHVMS